MSETFDVSAYMDVFMAEADDQLSILEQGLVKLEKESSPETLQSLFRAAHTLKGASAAMGFTRLADLTHAMESVLDALRHEQLAVTTHIVDVLLASLDALHALKETLKPGSEGDVPTDALLQDLQSITQSPRDDRPRRSPDGVPVPGGSPSVPLDITLAEHEAAAIELAEMRSLCALAFTVTLRHACPLKGVRAALVFSAAERLGEVIKAVPPADDLEEERFGDSFRFVIITADDGTRIEREVMGLSEIESVAFERVGAVGWENRGQPPVSVEWSGPSAPLARNRWLSPVFPARTQTQTPAAAEVAQVARRQTNVRVNVEQLDNLMNLVSELVIDRTVLEQVRTDLASRLGRQGEVASDLEDVATRIARRTTGLQDEVMKARMQPVDTVFSRFPRMVRDLAQRAGKRIDFQVQGGGTELDRSVIEVISDPLIHALRNAVDHGVESPEERVAAGKPETGSIVLAARHEGSYIVIEIRDDGEGIDPERVKRVAVSRRVITQEQADRMSDRETIELVFASGFSTAKEVTDVSGRGVGMDIVRTNIERINGRVDIQSVVGRGTVTSIRLPLTLAIIQALLVRAGGRTYALPLVSVQETERRARTDIQTNQGGETVVSRDRVLPLIRFSSALRFNRWQAESDEDRLFIVVVAVGDREAGIVVDHLIGEQEIVIKPLGSFIGDVRGISGATILGDGTVALICDVGALLGKVVDGKRGNPEAVMA